MPNSIGVQTIDGGFVPTFGQSTLVGLIENMLLKDVAFKPGTTIKDEGSFILQLNSTMARVRNEIITAQKGINVPPEERLEDIKFISYNISNNSAVNIVYFIKTVSNIFPNSLKVTNGSI